jgi:hypothetical protein
VKRLTARIFITFTQALKKVREKNFGNFPSTILSRKRLLDAV